MPQTDSLSPRQRTVFYATGSQWKTAKEIAADSLISHASAADALMWLVGKGLVERDHARPAKWRRKGNASASG